MVTIIGNGMGGYNFSNINIDISSFDKVICDKNFNETGTNIVKYNYKDTKEYIQSNYDKENILYIVTGSPYFFSAGILIAQTIPNNMVTIINNISSQQYIQEKLLIANDTLDTFSIHGKEHIDLTKFLTNTYTFIVCDEFSIEKISNGVKYLQSNDIEVTIGYKLGYDDERIEQIDIFDFNDDTFNLKEPYVLLIKRLFIPKPTVSDDSDFLTQRGMITKQYKRQLSLQNLDLKPNQLLWDIGAGSGSCGIEAFKRYKVRTIFFEKQPQRVEYIQKNLSNHFVLNSTLCIGNAEELFANYKESPSRIFIGGGGKKVINKLSYLYERLEENGIILINAITLQNLSQMITVLDNENISYEIFSISLTTYKGDLNLVEPERQLFQIKIYKDS